MAETTKCFTCSADIVVLSTYNGIERAFEVLDETDVKIPDTMRWHVRRDSNVAVPASMIPSAACPSDGFLVKHRCAQSRRGTGEPELERFAVTSATGPRVHETQLEPPYEYAYRWPTSWAHITLREGTLCGARQMIRDMSVAEHRRMMPMPVCAKCLDRYRLNRSTPPQAHGPASQSERRRQQTA